MGGNGNSLQCHSEESLCTIVEGYDNCGKKINILTTFFYYLRPVINKVAMDRFFSIYFGVPTSA